MKEYEKAKMDVVLLTSDVIITSGCPTEGHEVCGGECAEDD